MTNELQLIVTRFMNKVKKTPSCWLWTAAKDSCGYGQFRYKRKMVRTSRLSYEIHIGPIPSGLCVLHRCDNPACVKPKHLWLGSQSDNSRDMFDKDRATRKGESNPRAILNDALVIELRTRYESDPVANSLKRMAVELGMFEQTIYKAVFRLTWKHLE